MAAYCDYNTIYKSAWYKPYTGAVDLFCFHSYLNLPVKFLSYLYNVYINLVGLYFFSCLCAYVIMLILTFSSYLVYCREFNKSRETLNTYKVREDLLLGKYGANSLRQVYVAQSSKANLQSVGGSTDNISYPATDVSINLSETISNLKVLYLRKNKVFNKGRYSRNRQFYRTGVYWCLYVNIIAILGLYFWFYRFTLNFGYLWWLLFTFISSFIVPKAINYRLYSATTLVINIQLNLTWLVAILSSFILQILYTISNLVYKVLSSLYFSNSVSFFSNKNITTPLINLVSRLYEKTRSTPAALFL